jgi:ABC-type polysaccharide/polyol phosphate transport system ATPase subunit
MSDTVIKVENLSKKYRLGVINRRMLVDQIESWVARKLGKPDPHSSVFEHATDRLPTPYDFWALKDVSFKIEQGDIVGVMGRNGSGKSTLLKLLSRITSPTTGTAKIKGRVASLLEVGTGFNHEMTGKENVFLNGSILGMRDKEIQERYERIAEFAEIPDFMDTPVKRYSSGMRVRLAFAVAAHLEPEILVLDEVLAVGDAKFQEKCLNRIDEIKNSGVTILFVSHSSQSVLKLCTKGILLEEGRLVAEGTAREVTDRYLESLHLKTDSQAGEPGLPDSRTGLFLGKLAGLFSRRLGKGQVVLNAPVETSEGCVVADLGWVSDARMQTLRTEPSWSAAPDIVVHAITPELSQFHADRARHLLIKSGARESWVLWPNGRVDRYHEVSRPPIVDFLPKSFSILSADFSV